ncbi:unnamed protein product [Didymodactylos carnosus]|uniref:protein-tyrosine-phosphatase n=1 Tax=Didymodactylos carnosus TaxID=1234261 RepID=A0A8S2FV63_9BILA|nr:unnamed protein product [Didymodactylos carnosus]CAF4359724.1 unnamed protein product [Didymodactylos carnosus]
MNQMLKPERQCLERIANYNTMKFYNNGASILQCYRQRLPSTVLQDFLFLGNFDHACDVEQLRSLGIKHISKVCNESLNETILNNFNVCHVNLRDLVETNIKEHFQLTNDFLRMCYLKNEKVLCHCHAGISRSATAYLMKYLRVKFEQAYYYLSEKRIIICPNIDFLIQVVEYEHDLLKDISNQNDNN